MKGLFRNLPDFLSDLRPITEKTSRRREKNAFDLGRDCGMSDAARLIHKSVESGQR